MGDATEAFFLVVSWWVCRLPLTVGGVRRNMPREAWGTELGYRKRRCSGKGNSRSQWLGAMMREARVEEEIVWGGGGGRVGVPGRNVWAFSFHAFFSHAMKTKQCCGKELRDSRIMMAI